MAENTCLEAAENLWYYDEFYYECSYHYRDCL